MNSIIRFSTSCPALMFTGFQLFLKIFLVCELVKYILLDKLYYIVTCFNFILIYCSTALALFAHCHQKQ